MAGTGQVVVAEAPRCDGEPASRPAAVWDGSSSSVDQDEAVSAAVSVVVASARQGVVALCASVAHIIRQNRRLQQQVAALEKKHTSVIVSSRRSETCDKCGSTIAAQHSPLEDYQSLPDSPASQRCGSAPPAFLASPLKFTCSDQPEHCNGEVRKPPAVPSTPGGQPAFLRGPGCVSTRSLNLSRPSTFMRRKYSTMSLRRVQRSGSCWGGSTAGSSSSSGVSLGQPGSSSSSRTCMVTVAEVYPAPCTTPPHCTTESETVKLLARKLSHLLTGDEAGDPLDGDPLDGDPHTTCAPPPSPQVCAPHPLAGCECVVCAHSSAHADAPVYVLSTNEGCLLPRGSTVLVAGGRVGTILYLGHRRHPSTGPAGPPTASYRVPAGVGEDEGQSWEDSRLTPVGVTLTLCSPGEGEVFVPLNDIICQLDDEEEEEGGGEVHIDGLGHVAAPCLHQDPTPATSSRSVSPSRPQHQATPNTGPSHTSSTSQGDATNLYSDDPAANPDLDTGFNNSVLNIKADERDCLHSQVDTAHRYTLEQHSVTDGDMRPSLLNIPSVKMVGDENSLILSPKFPSICRVENEIITGKRKMSESEISLYDTSDSAISLYFTHKLTEQSSHRPSVSDPDTDSLHLGDTWDSGCYLRRGRFPSEGSQTSLDPEWAVREPKQSVWATSLSRALESVWQKHGGSNSFCVTSHDSHTWDPEYTDKPRKLNHTWDPECTDKPRKLSIYLEDLPQLSSNTTSDFSWISQSEV